MAIGFVKKTVTSIKVLQVLGVRPPTSDKIVVVNDLNGLNSVKVLSICPVDGVEDQSLFHVYFKIKFKFKLLQLLPPIISCGNKLITRSLYIFMQYKKPYFLYSKGNGKKIFYEIEVHRKDFRNRRTPKIPLKL